MNNADTSNKLRRERTHMRGLMYSQMCKLERLEIPVSIGDIFAWTAETRSLLANQSPEDKS